METHIDFHSVVILVLQKMALDTLHWDINCTPSICLSSLLSNIEKHILHKNKTFIYEILRDPCKKEVDFIILLK